LRKGGIEAAAAEHLVANLKEDYLQADLNPQDRAMLDYCLKLTKTPEAMNAADVERLRSHGFDDLAIHDICSIVAYFAFVNRIADGLGVELEAGFGH
jgi:uncharacterized peroxidase-related enzyme